MYCFIQLWLLYQVSFEGFITFTGPLFVSHFNLFLLLVLSIVKATTPIRMERDKGDHSEVL